MKNNTTQKNIPQGWQEKKLGDVCDIVNGSTPKRSVSEYWENGNIPWFTVDDIRSNGRIISKTNQSITDKALKETSVKLLPEDSVLLCCTASLGEVALTKIPLTTNQQFNGLVSKDKKNLFPYYLFYSAQKLGEGLKSKSGKTTINFLSVGSLSKEKVLVPPIKEQQKIAEILGTVDEDIAKTQGVIDATGKLKRGLMQQLFTRGIGHTKFKETKIGRTPESWEIKEMKEICDIESGSTPKTGVSEYWDGDIVWITPLDLSRLENRYIETSSRKITQLGLQNSSAVIIPKKSLIMSSRAPIGYLAINNTDCATNQGCKSFIPKSNNNVEFLYYYLDLNMSRIKKLGAGSTFAEVGSKALETLLVATTKLKEQKEIADILSAVDEKISVNKKLKEKLTLLKRGLMQDLLSGKVRTNI